MRPSSPNQHTASLALQTPDVDEVAPGVWSIPLAVPDPHNPYSFCYAILGSDDSLHLLDPGYDTEANWDALVRGLAALGSTPDAVASVFSTHAHPDHVGLNARIRSTSGARVLLPKLEWDAIQTAHAPADLEAKLSEWGVPDDRRPELRGFTPPTSPEMQAPDAVLADGELWDIPGRILRILATPGHTPGHASVVDEGAGIFFSGDHVLPNVFPGLGLGVPTPSNPIADYLASSERLTPFDELQVAPGHGFRFTGLVERATEISEHHLRRSRETAAVLQCQPDASIWQIASQLHWTAGWDNLTGFYVLSALSQVEQHRAFVGSDVYQG